MKKHTYFGIIIITLLVLIPGLAFATITASFGGRVIGTSIPLVNCTGIGTGPVVLISSLEHLGSAVVYTTASPGNQTSVPTRAKGVVSGIYGAIPFYTNENGASEPSQGDWILGNANIVPNFSTCSIQVGTFKIPFPVRPTSNYRVSGRSSSL
jgi:hypothetical protein